MAHNKTLMKLRWFQAAVLVPLLLAGAVGYYISSPEAFVIPIEPHRLNELLVLYKIPLGIAAFVFPLVALVAANHRSVQTAAQIKEVESKNNFENTLKHREIFYKRLEEIEKKYEIAFEDKTVFYKRVFSENDNSSFSFYCDTMEYLEPSPTFNIRKTQIKLLYLLSSFFHYFYISIDKKIEPKEAKLFSDYSLLPRKGKSFIGFTFFVLLVFFTISIFQ